MMRTGRLLLRRPIASDVDPLYSIYGDPRTNKYNPFGPYPDRDKAKTVLAGWMEHWHQNGFGQWAISTFDAPSEVIGFGGVAFRKYLHKDVLNLGYRFSVESWGRGYATELGRAALRHAFSDLRVPQVFAIVRPANQPSIRVLDKLGMILVGTLDDVPGDSHSLMYRADAENYSGG